VSLDAPAPAPGARPRPKEKPPAGSRSRPVSGGPPLPDLGLDAAYDPEMKDVMTRYKATRVVSANNSVLRRLGDIWRSRELLVYLVRTEIKVKYKNSFLGLVWSMLSPAMNLAVYDLVFGVLLKNGIPNFVIYLFSGLLLWNFFSTAVQTATGVVVNNAGLVKKVSFPREILALAAVGSAGVFFFFQACVFVIFMAALQNWPSLTLIWLVPVALLPVIILAGALATFLSAVNVYLRDTQHLVEVLIGTAWFWFCPIVYSYQRQVWPRLGPHGIPTFIYSLNPMTPPVMTFQRVLYNRMGTVTLTTSKTALRQFVHLPFFQRGFMVRYVKPTIQHAQLLPNWHPLTYVGQDALVLVFGLVLFYFALVVFGRLAGNFAEEL
jgi:ABC-2 type transport system permease protein